MPGAEETLIEHRERKQIAADIFAKAQRDLIKTKFERDILPNLIRVFDATCVGLNISDKKIMVRFDPVRPDLEFLRLTDMIQEIPWDRKKLTAAQIVGQRLKILVVINNGFVGMSLGAITTSPS